MKKDNYNISLSKTKDLKNEVGIRKMVVFDNFFNDLETEWYKLVDEGIEYYFQHKYENNNITSDESSKAILRLANNQTPFELFRKDLNDNCHLSRHCIAVGVVSDSDTIVDVVVCSQMISTLHLKKDVPELIVMNKTILPVVALVYVEQEIIKHNPNAHIKVIYAHLNNEYRTNFAITSWKIQTEDNEWFHIYGGVLRTKASSEFEYKTLPSLIEPWKRMLGKKKQLTEIIEQELIEKTWHPSRFFDWCLSIDEK